MAVNSSRSMNADFDQGTIDNTYIQLTPNRGATREPTDRALRLAAVPQRRASGQSPPSWRPTSHARRCTRVRSRRRATATAVSEMATARRTSAFQAGTGVEPESHVCAECGYSHTNRKNFKRTEDGEGYTCSTGHYQTRTGTSSARRTSTLDADATPRHLPRLPHHRADARCAPQDAPRPGDPGVQGRAAHRHARRGRAARRWSPPSTRCWRSSSSSTSTSSPIAPSRTASRSR